MGNGIERDSKNLRKQKQTKIAYYDVAKHGDAFIKIRNTGKCKLLPAPLSLMNYAEKLNVAKNKILKDHWNRGGKKNRIVYGEEEFKHSLWMDEEWPWSSVKGMERPAGQRQPGG